MNTVAENLPLVDRQLPWQALTVGCKYRTVDRRIVEADGRAPTASRVALRKADDGPAARCLPADLPYRLMQDLIARTFIRQAGPVTVECAQGVQSCVRVGDILHAVVEVEEVQPDWRTGQARVALNVEIRTAGGERVLTYTACHRVEGGGRQGCPAGRSGISEKMPGEWLACQMLRTAADCERPNGRMVLF